MDASVVRKTPARSAITEFLSESNSPVDVLQIVNFLRSKSLNTNKVTVYRIIEYFYKEGIVSRFDLQEGKFRYELKRSDHHHLICESCGKIDAVLDTVIPEMEKEIQKKQNFLVKRHSLEFFGLCKNCQN